MSFFITFPCRVQGTRICDCRFQSAGSTGRLRVAQWGSEKLPRGPWQRARAVVIWHPLGLSGTPNCYLDFRSWYLLRGDCVMNVNDNLLNLGYIWMSLSDQKSSVNPIQWKQFFYSLLNLIWHIPAKLRWDAYKGNLNDLMDAWPDIATEDPLLICDGGREASQFLGARIFPKPIKVEVPIFAIKGCKIWQLCLNDNVDGDAMIMVVMVVILSEWMKWVWCYFLVVMVHGGPLQQHTLCCGLAQWWYDCEGLQMRPELVSSQLVLVPNFGSYLELDLLVSSSFGIMFIELIINFYQSPYDNILEHG